MPEDNSILTTTEADVETRVSGAETNEIDLRMYALMMRKHRWVILLFTVMATALAWWVVNDMTPIYRATSELLIEEKSAKPIAIQDLFEGVAQDNDYYHTQYEVLRSRRLAKRVMEKLELFDHPEFHKASDAEATSNVQLPATAIADSASGVAGAALAGVNAESAQQQLAVNRFMARLAVNPIKKTKLVTISFESADPVLAAQVANAVAEGYIINYMDTRLEMSESASAWLAERLAGIKVRLTEAQSRLLDYKERHGLVDAGGGVGGLNEQQVAIVTSKLIESQRVAAEAKILFDEVSLAGKSNPEALLSLPVINADPLVAQYKITRQEARFSLDELLNRYGKKHPRVVDASSRYRAATDNLHQQILSIVDSIEKDYQLSKHSVSALQQTLDAEKGKIQAVDRDRMELITLEQEVEANRQLYDTFYVRIREVDEAEDLSSSNAQISEIAEVPITPVKPNKTLIIMLAAIVGFGVVVGCVLLYESMDATINSTTDIEEHLRVRMLGIIPLVGKKAIGSDKTKALVPGKAASGTRQFEESIRTIRTSICLDDLQSKQQVIMVTSALPSEGKSTLASHLAYSFSQLERVLLIECDMRRPSLHLAFEFDAEVGLSELLNGQCQFAECINLDVVGDLDVIAAGAIPDKPLELLSSKRFDHLIEKMKSRYDRIVIDSAPVQAVSDALLLGQHADAVIYAVKAGVTPSVVCERGVARLRHAGINVAGAVVTNVDIGKINGYGGELQYQGYYDYYGYSGVERLQVDTSEYKKPKAVDLESV